MYSELQNIHYTSNYMQEKAIEHIVQKCAAISYNSKVIVIYDEITKYIANLFITCLYNKCKELQTYRIEITDIHGCEPSDYVAKAMKKTDIILCITKSSLAHTEARRKACEKGVRFLSMPGYTINMLKSKAIFADYQEMLPVVHNFSEYLSLGKKLVVTTELGTNIGMDINGRIGNCCPGFVNEKYLLGSPPDIEANIAPNEELSEGEIVVDGSITHECLGILQTPVRLKISKGKIIKITSDNKEYESILNSIFQKFNTDKVYYLAECGIGCNPMAELCGNMLIDEGTMGCVHFGFGSNHTINGKNNVSFHLDFIIRNPTLVVDDTILIRKGVIVYEKYNA